MNTRRTIYSRAPTRIDLAGGTIDIWPIYLFLRNPLTVNLGISLFAEAKLELIPFSKGASSEPPILLKSDDQKKEISLTWRQLEEEFKPPAGLELHAKLLTYFYEKKIKGRTIDYQLVLSTRAQSPAGAGLGGSSTLSIAMIGALASWTAEVTGEGPIIPDRNGEDFIEIVRDVETTVIQVPAGLQDYYGAMYGGLQSIEWGAGKHSRKKLPDALIPELESRLLLFYSGQSRNSGINNWVLFKNFVDRVGEVRSQFQQIADATRHLETAFEKQDWNSVGDAIAQEWTIRKTLASGITTPEIDRAFSEAKKLAPISGKVCGAGGGGCFFIYLPIVDPKERLVLRKKIQELFQKLGVEPLAFQATRQGLEVRTESSA
jgi:D-glycero-alpha-D-manno-heptose-7-phosphate kinase